MKRILVPTDFSVSAKKAAQYALQIANKSGAEIILLHVCSLPDPTYSDDQGDIHDYNRLRTMELSTLLRQYRASLDAAPGVSIKTILVEGETIDTVVQKAEAYQVDLIVMGTRGASGLKALVMGTRTAAVMKATEIPVIAVPEAYEGNAMKNIVLAIQKEEDAALLQPVIALQDLFGAQLKTVIFTEQDAPVATMLEDSHTMVVATHRLQKTFGKNNLLYENIEGADFQEAIEDYVRTHNVDLLVMVSHRKSLLQRLFRSSMTRKMAFHTRIPLMTLHES